MERSPGIEASLAAYAGLMLVGAGLCASSVVLYRRTKGEGRLPAVGIAVLPGILVCLGLSMASSQLVNNGSVPEFLAMAYRGIVAIGQFLVWAVVAVAFDRLRRRHGTNVSASVDGPNPSE